LIAYAICGKCSDERGDATALAALRDAVKEGPDGGAETA